MPIARMESFFVRFLNNMQEIDQLGVDRYLNFTFGKQKNKQRHTIHSGHTRINPEQPVGRSADNEH